MGLGFTVPPRSTVKERGSVDQVDLHGTNTRVSLWPDRWPAIALQACIDKVEAAAPEDRAEVKFNLPCQDCPQSSRCLTAKRKELGPLLYDREIQTQPRTSESSLFPDKLLLPLLQREQSLVPYWNKPFSLEHYFKVVQAWDIAWSEKIGGDWLVCMTGVIDLRNGQRQLLDIGRWQRIAFDDQVKMMGAQWQAFRADLVVIESDAAQVVWTKHVGRNTAVPVLPHSASDKTDLAVGVPGLLILLENRKWSFPYQKGTYHHENAETFVAELGAFGWQDGKLQGVGEHDDTVMAWYHLNWGMDRMALGQGAVGEHYRGVQDGVH